MKPDGYYVFRSPTNNIWSGQRALDSDPAKAKALMAGMKIYPYAQRENPPVTKHVTPGGKKWSAAQPRGMAYWEGLARTIGQEPVIERDRMMLAMIRPLGIEKGKPFKPDERQAKILTEAALVGELMARTNGYAKRFPGAKVWPNITGSSRYSSKTSRRRPRTTLSSMSAAHGFTKPLASPSA